MAIPETIEILPALIVALIMFAINGLLAFGGAWVAIKMALAALAQKVDYLETEVTEHKTTLYGVNLSNGIRSHTQDHGSRITTLERHVFKGRN